MKQEAGEQAKGSFFEKGGGSVEHSNEVCNTPAAGHLLPFAHAGPSH